MSKKQLIVFDLDGPLLEGRFRHYECYSRILRRFGFQPIPLERYWSSKRSSVRMDDILEQSSARSFYAEFKKHWLMEIETPALLVLDRLQPGVVEFLTELKTQGASCIIATLRQNEDGAKNQLVALGLSAFFDSVLVTPHALGANGKSDSVKFFCDTHGLTAKLWIGDTEIDAAAALRLNVPCVLMSCGLRESSYLMTLGAKCVRETLDEIPKDLVYGSK